MWFLSTALAASLSVVIEIQPEGATLVDAVLLQSDAPSTEGPVQVRDAEGNVLATAGWDHALHRSVVYPDGGGDAVTLTSGAVRIRVPWPDGATQVTLGDVALPPRTAPPAEALQLSGDSTDRLDMVFLGDGYTVEQQDDYAADVDTIVNYLLSIDPYGAYTGLFNIWRIDTVSNESGASHYEQGQNLERDTAYGCFYGCGGIDRLLCCDDSKVMGAVNQEVPQADGVLVLVNDPTYGGAGGFNYATSYNGDVGTLVAAHEIGHSLVGLWDEYSYGYATSVGDGPNCAADPDDPPWPQWLDEPGVGAFSTCSYTNYHRPTDADCMMNTLQDDYCPVCREQAVLAIYAAVPDLILNVTQEGDTLSLPVDLEVEAIGPDSGELDVVWSVDGVEVASGAAATVPCVAGETLTVTVRDPTPWVRLDEDDLLQAQRSWPLNPCEPADSGDTGAAPNTPTPCGCGTPAAPWMGLAWAFVIAVRRKRV